MWNETLGFTITRWNTHSNVSASNRDKKPENNWLIGLFVFLDKFTFYLKICFIKVYRVT